MPDKQILPDVQHFYTACSTLMALAQPYKRKYMNVADTLILAILAIPNISDIESSEWGTSALFFYTSGSILTSLPLFGLIGVLVFEVISKIVQLPCYKRLRLCIYQHGGRNNDDGQTDDQISI